MPYYRKRIIAACQALQFLDDRPISDNERMRADEFVTMGCESQTTISTERKEDQQRNELDELRLVTEEATELDPLDDVDELSNVAAFQRDPDNEDTNRTHHNNDSVDPGAEIPIRSLRRWDFDGRDDAKCSQIVEIDSDDEVKIEDLEEVVQK